jgi:chromate reductase, NAD(P)H dehydrogenase (quinone)
LVHVRSILNNIGVLVLPDQTAIGNAYQAFDENSNLKDESQQAVIGQLGIKLAAMIVKLTT